MCCQPKGCPCLGGHPPSDGRPSIGVVDLSQLAIFCAIYLPHESPRPILPQSRRQGRFRPSREQARVQGSGYERRRSFVAWYVCDGGYFPCGNCITGMILNAVPRGTRFRRSRAPLQLCRLAPHEETVEGEGPGQDQELVQRQEQGSKIEDHSLIVRSLMDRASIDHNLTHRSLDRLRSRGTERPTEQCPRRGRSRAVSHRKYRESHRHCHHRRLRSRTG